MKHLAPQSGANLSRQNICEVRCLRLLGVILIATASASNAGDSATNSSQSSSLLKECFSGWLAMVAATQAEQPHWAPPMAMGQPLLDQVFRYDISWQKLPDGHTLNNFGSGKGFEFIVAKRVELGIAVPAWLTQESPPGAQKRGWADENFFIKYRLAAGNETNSNYSAVALLNVSAPTGSEAYTAHHFIFTPTLGFGKGWGNSAIQSTVAISVPDNGVTSNGMGTPIAVNVAAQYHWRKIFWPEVELNYTHWPNGVNEGRNQLLITPGLVLGKFQVWRRAGFQIGVAYQVALTEDPTYRRNFILSARFPF